MLAGRYLKNSIYGLLFLAVLFGLYIISRHNYLLYHGFAEAFSIVVACGIFMLATNSRKILENTYLLFIGNAYLFVGLLDFLHMMAYDGMGVFPEHGPNLPTQLWIAARYVESLSLFIAPFLFRKNITISILFSVYSGITIILLATIIYFGIFPDCFIEGRGLTGFKRISECVISLILVGAIMLLVKKKEEFDGQVYRLLIASIIITIGSELSFTLYANVFDLANTMGHVLKIVSFYLIYKAIIETGLVRPYDLLFRKLKQSEEKLNAEKTQLIKAMTEVKTLTGLLPMCATCKKIRDDKGYWNQLEAYIRDHSDAEFSHGICPGCAKELYAELDHL
jgi:hypothetical protein